MSASGAGPGDAVDPGAVGNAVAAAVGTVVEGAVAEGRLAGAVVLVRRAGVAVCAVAAGLADREAGTPVARETPFRLASMTKPIVSATALACAEAGLLSIDDPVTRFLPGFRPPTPQGDAAAITIRHLLTHTAGLGYGFMADCAPAYRGAGVSDGLDRPGFELAENVGRLGRLPLGFAPGTAWRYSLATDVLGAVLEAACESGLADLVERHVTGPLGMTRTRFSADASGPLATAYADPAPQESGQPGTRERGTGPRRMSEPFTATLPDGGTQLFSPGRAFDPNSYPSGGAGMVGTADDYIAFLEAIRTGGAPILSGASAAALTGDAIPGLDLGPGQSGWGFGLGVACLRDPVAALTDRHAGTWGWGGSYGTSFWVDPVAELSVVALTNTSTEGTDGPFTRALAEAVSAASQGAALHPEGDGRPLHP